MTNDKLRQRFIDYKAGRLTLTEAIDGINETAKTGNWTDEDLREAFKAGVLFTYDMVNTPNVDEYLKQLKASNDATAET